LLLAALLAGLPPGAAAQSEAPPPEKKRIRAVFVGDEPLPPAPGAVWESEGRKVEVIHLEDAGLGKLLARGYLGVQPLDLTTELRRHFGAPEDAGVLVARVEDDSPAQTAGIQVGDVVTRVQGTPVASTWDLMRSLRERKEGEVVTLEVFRQGRSRSLSVTIRERPRAQVDIRRFVGGPGGEGPFLLHLEGDGLPEAIEGLQKRLASPQLHRWVQDPPCSNPEIEQRLKELENRLQELERELDGP
jgi:hypothetical protein